ncbi:MAG: major capsid protein [Bacteroidota bacterium]
MNIRDFGGDVTTTTVVNTMVENSNILSIAEFYSMVGNADYKRKAAAANGGKFRPLNTDYADNQVNPEFANPVLVIFGDKVEVDRAHERRGSDVPSVRASMLIDFAKNLGKNFQNYFFNGDKAADEKQFNGLKKIIPAGQILTPEADGLAVPLGNSDTNKSLQQAFLEALDTLIGSVDGGAQAIAMDSDMVSRLTRIAEAQVQWAVDEFGKPLAKYNGVPIIPAGFDSAGNKIIKHDEVCGAANDTTSIYAFRFGEESDLSIATSVGVEVKDLGLVGVHYTHSVDFDLDLTLLRNRSVARLKGLRIKNL